TLKLNFIRIVRGERHNVGSYEPRPGVTIQCDAAADRLARAHCLDLPRAAPCCGDLGRLAICLCRHPLERQGRGAAELLKAVFDRSFLYGRHATRLPSVWSWSPWPPSSSSPSAFGGWPGPIWPGACLRSMPRCGFAAPGLRVSPDSSSA